MQIEADAKKEDDSEKERRDFLDLNEVVKNSLKFVNAQLKVHDFSVILDLMENLPEIELNPIQIEQVLLNFVTNARFSVILQMPIFFVNLQMPSFL